MSGSLSDYLEAKLADGVLGGPDFTHPATVWLALFTVTPADAGGGTECTGGSYARASTANNSTNWPAATGTSTVKANGTAITFPTATAAWGTVVAWALFDAVTAGNLLFWGAVGTAKAVGINDTPNFPIGAITLLWD